MKRRKHAGRRKAASKACRSKVDSGYKRYRVRQPLHTYVETIVWARDKQEASDLAGGMCLKNYNRQLVDNAQCEGAEDVEEIYP